MGGGERYTLDFARVLAADGHQVELVTHQPLDVHALKVRLAFDLQQVSSRQVPDSPGNQLLSNISAEYDVFLNLSHGDLFRCQARKSILVVHFPLPLEAYSPGGIPTSGLANRFRPSRVYWIEGVYQPETDGQQHWLWTGRRARIELMRTWQQPTDMVVIRLAKIRPASVPPPLVRAFINGILAGERADDWTIWRVPLEYPPLRGQVVQVVLEVEPWTLRDLGLAADDRERGVPLQSVALAGNELEERVSERVWRKLQVTGWSTNEVIHAIDSYDHLVANSQFTQQWITQRWERNSRVIYPAVDTEHTSFNQSTKQQQILSVGRFFEGGHNKQHLAMINAFRELHDGELRDWEYHLVGGCDLDQPEQRSYLERVRQAAQGYPITLHVNASLTELQQRYREASIFWHAAGLDVDETRTPDNVEHFGITTIEAMAAGCVPIVIAKGGLIETVEAEQNGLLWHSLDELKTQTQRLVNNTELRTRLAVAARNRSYIFRFERFANEVQAMLASLGSG